MEVGRRKKEEPVIARVSAIKNVLTVLAVAIILNLPYSGSQKSEVCPMPYALCPMPYALCPVVPHLSEKGYKRQLTQMNTTFAIHTKNSSFFFNSNFYFCWCQYFERQRRKIKMFCRYLHRLQQRWIKQIRYSRCSLLSSQNYFRNSTV